MVAKLGINASIGIALGAAADPYGTALAVSEKLIVESISWSENVNKLSSAGIGSGGILSDNMERGFIAGTLSISGLCGYDNGFPLFLAQFMGTAGTPTEQNASEGDYLHSILMSGAANANFITLALESSSTTVIEFPSVTVNSITISASPGDFLRYTIEANFDQLVTTSTENSNAEIQAVTTTDTEYSIAAFEESFQMNAQTGGAFSSDEIAITSYELSLSRPQSFKPEIKGSAGNSVPTADDKAVGTLSIGLKEHTDNTYETAAIAASEYKSSLNIQGTQIASGDTKTIELLLPRMKLIDTPDFGLSSAGNNPVTLVFDLLEATANPTGMSDTTPYVELTNETSTAYIS